MRNGLKSILPNAIVSMSGSIPIDKLIQPRNCKGKLLSGSRERFPRSAFGLPGIDVLREAGRFLQSCTGIIKICTLILVAVTTLVMPETAPAQSAMTQFEQASSQSSRIDTLQDIATKWPVEVYQPWDASESQKQLQRLRGVQRKYEGRFPESPEELLEVADAVAPFLRYLYLYDLHFSPHSAVVAPGGVTSLEIDSYCLDAGLPSPPANEPLRLVKNSGLFPPAVMSIYRSLMRHNAAQDSNAIQGLLWTLRSVNDGKSNLDRLSTADASLLERVHPGAMDTLYRTYRLDSILPKMGGRPVRNVEGFVKGLLEQQVGSVLGSHGVAWSPGDSVEDTLSRMVGLKAEGRMDPSNAYTELAPGVIARGINIQGHSRFGVDFVNTSQQPFVFNIADYIAQPSRRAQRLAFGRARNVLSPSVRDEAGRQRAITALRDLSKGNFANGSASRPDPCRMEVGWAPDIRDIYSAMPVLSEMISLVSLVTGKNVLTGEALTWSDRLYAAVNVLTLPGGAVKGVVKGTRLAIRAAGAMNAMKNKPSPKDVAIALGMGKLQSFTAATENCVFADPTPNQSLPIEPTPLELEVNRIADDPSRWYCAESSSSPRKGLARLRASSPPSDTLARDYHAAFCAQP